MVEKKSFFKEYYPIIIIAFIKLVLHFITNTNLLGYGYFIDEFYYYACAMRLDFGYVDHPPLAPFILHLNHFILGDSLFALRFLPALAGAALVFLTGIITKELGGKTFAQIIATLAVTFSPVILVLNSFFSMNAFEVLIWVFTAYLIILLIKKDNPKIWILIGIIAGIGLENKHTMVLFGIGMILGLLLTKNRKYILNKWFFIAGIIAFLIILPNIIWQITHGFPSLEFYKKSELIKGLSLSPLNIFIMQIISYNPFFLPLWFAGIIYFFFLKEGKNYRLIGWIYLFIFLILILQKSSRPDRIAGLYPLLFAAGAILFENLIINIKQNWIRILAISFVIIGGLILLPFSLPVLTPKLTDKYLTFIGLNIKIEKGSNRSRLPQYLADRLDWEELIKELSKVYNDLPEAEKKKAVIIADSYATAGSAEFFGKKYNLPKVISIHNNYHLWGYDGATGDIMITFGFNEQEVSESFEEYEVKSVFKSQYSRLNGLQICVAKKLKYNIKDIWTSIKKYE
ncbi:MAG: hypothetical protein A2086_05765 [Spirochaetes bacterium GWD1_27_9]|nr:MAG: hypothetical protein A2Z98_05990 [Spirochaetes bacterium GWB1_27_13]OHD20270.1 MAG: hypothetical protein A2Y34_15080 [Spirochaetes bacterium GWC1_27_15]OHD35284.1 MAG: hypothetical protein A2086_05765 [Spirochaetes bacterium GWD1_27_9]